MPRLAVMGRAMSHAPLKPWLTVAALMLTGCATPSEHDADYTARHMPVNYRAVTAAYLHKTFRDPASIRDPEISNMLVQPLRWSGFRPRPNVCVRLVGRNLFGSSSI